MLCCEGGGGLSRPVPVKRGIRQGCPISGQLYSVAIEPLLCRLRTLLKGPSLPKLAHSPPIVVSAYADDVNVLVQGQGDIQELEASLAVYENATTARVNWGKSEACVIGQWDAGRIPRLPGNLTWGIRGLKVLGLYLGSNEIERQNWEGVLRKVQAMLQCCLSGNGCSDRTLIVNNLVAASCGTDSRCSLLHRDSWNNCRGCWWTSSGQVITGSGHPFCTSLWQRGAMD